MRTVEREGFNKKKNRDFNNKKYLLLWRQCWAEVQNRGYERNGFKTRVSSDSYEVQGKDREPRKYLSRIDWEKEHQGIHTVRGDENRKIEQINKNRKEQKRQREPERYNSQEREHGR